MTGIEVVIDSSQSQTPEPQEDDSKGKKPVNLGKYLSYLKYSSVDARDISVSYSEGQKDFLVDGIKFEWVPEQRAGSIGFESLDVGPVILGESDCGLAVSEEWDAIEISDFDLSEGVTISELSAISTETALGWRAVSNVYCYGADVKLEFDPEEAKPSRVSLVSGQLNLEGLRDDLGIGESRFPKGSVSKCDLVFSGDPKSPRSWNGSLALQVEGGEMGSIRLGKVSGAMDVAAGVVNLRNLHVEEGGSTVEVSGRTDLSAMDSVADVEWSRLAAEGALNVHSDDLSELVVVSTGAPPKLALGGLIDADLEWAIADGRLLKLAGPVKGEKLTVGNANADQVDIECDSSEPDRVSLNGRVRFDEVNAVELRGGYGIKSGDYQASAELSAGDLGTLRASLSDVAEDAASFGGTAVASIQASGNTIAGEYALTGSFDVKQMILGDADPLAVSGEFAHNPTATHLRAGRLGTGELVLTIDAGLEAGLLSVEKVAFLRGNDELIAGSLSVPFDPERVKSAQTFLNQTGEIAADLLIRETSVSDLYRIAGRETAGITGSVRGELMAGGTLNDPVLDAGLQLIAIGLEERVGEIEPADASLQFSVRDHRFNVNGQVTQAEIEPMSIVGELPFHPNEWMEPGGGKGAFSTEVLDLVVVLPPTSLKKLEDWVPAISMVDGSVFANVRVSGTVGEPSITGEMEADLPRLRFHQSELPDLKDARCRIEFSGTEIVLSELKGTAAGGAFLGKGRVDVANLNDPVLDLSLNAQEALFYRTEELSVRSNLAVSVTGPVSLAQVTADVALVNSRYQKEIDLLPIALPERGPKMPSVTGPRAAKSVPKIGTETLPFANWDVDVHFKTSDPFLIVGNLATSEVHADMQISGKGRDLKPSGEVRLEEAMATLPFSTLVIDLATLSFLPETGFDPKISVDGGAEVDDYQVRIHVYNSLFHPEYILTSSPPLEEEDIISLIVTGATREQLEASGQGQAMAKGGKLLLEKLRQVKGLSSAEQMLIPRNLTFDIGGVNQRTGEPTATAKLKLRDRIFVLGNVDAEGQYRGVLKWAIRFR
ncbi:MAG: translocation/assembly module TamB domain-containing protein [Verrucomicrobiales bacterium]